MQENLIDALEHLAGFALVLITLSFLWGVTALIGRYFISKAAQAKAATQTATSNAAASPANKESDPDAIPDDILVVIASAVTTLLDRPYRVVSVRTAQSRWGVQGRSELHASHRLR